MPLYRSATPALSRGVDYENDSFITLTAHFSVTNATTAKAAASQSVT